jgi:hypothetical protein
MFWIGIIIAFSSGLIAISSVRSRIKNKFPKIQNNQLDFLLFFFLLIGLTISSIDHYNTDLLLDKLEVDARKIDSIHGLVSLTVNGNWANSTPPNEPIRFIFGGKEVLTLNMTSLPGEKNNLKFVGRGSPYFSISKTKAVRFQFQISPLPDSWILGKDKDKITDCGIGQIRIPGLYPAITSDSELRIESLSIEADVKGKPFFQVFKEINKKIKLKPGSNSIKINWDEKECKRVLGAR